MRKKFHLLLLGLGVMCLLGSAPTNEFARANAASIVSNTVANPPITISAPATAMVYDEVKIRITSGKDPVAGVELRVIAPSRTVAYVTATSLNVRVGPGTEFPVWGIVYRDDIVLVLSSTSTGWCEVVLPAGAGGYSACEFLDLQPYGQPLGSTDRQGELLTGALAIVPSSIEIGGFLNGVPVGSAKISVRPYEYDFTEDVAPGIAYRERRFVINDEGPFTMQILEVDPAQAGISILPARANDRAITRERTSSIARRYGATAAVNGGYFVVSGTYAGSSAGVYMFDREVVSGGAGRTALIFCEESDPVQRFELDVVDFRGNLIAEDGATHGVSGMNRARAAQDMLIYRAILGPSTLTDNTGVEIAVDFRQQVTRVEDGIGNAAIPANGEVVSASGTFANWLRQHAAVGMTLASQVELNPRTPPEVTGCTPLHVAGGGPRLVRKGEINVTMEGFGHETTRHPRTAFALTGHGTFLFVTLDGRQSSSAGMRLNELAQELIDLGAVEAMNFDGGGSSTMVVRDQVRNSPSDGSERPVSDALLIFASAPTRQ